LNQGGLWAFAHDKKRYTAPIGSIKPPKDLANPKPTKEALQWHRAMMQTLSPGWPFPPMVRRVMHLSDRTAKLLDRLQQRHRQTKSDVIRIAIERLLTSKADVGEPPGPRAINLSFYLGTVESERFDKYCVQRCLPRWKAVDFAVQRMGGDDVENV
jgi:hypothetical protein